MLLVYLGTYIDLGTFVLTLNIKNIVLGIGISTFVGVASGIERTEARTSSGSREALKVWDRR